MTKTIAVALTDAERTTLRNALYICIDRDDIREEFTDADVKAMQELAAKIAGDL
jgi:hypothetical protein